MKKVLLGTTALVAAGMLGAGDAQAKFDVTVRGNGTFAWGFVNEEDELSDGTPPVAEAGFQRQNQAMNQDFEVHFRFEQTLDNGMVWGGRVELEGATHNGSGPTTSFSAGDDQVDERWIYARGGWGELRMGDEDDVRKLKALVAPEAAAPMFGVNSPMFSFNNLGAAQAAATNGTLPNLENDSAKIIYFTPVMKGFQLGASYAPDGTQDRFQGGTGGTQDVGPTGVPQVSNAVSIAGDYTGDLGGVKLNLMAGYSFANNEVGEGDPNVLQAGVNVRFGAFAVGGSVAFSNLPAPNDERTVFDIGGTYRFDAAAVSLAWSHGKYENQGETDTLDHAQLGFGYTVGDGILFGAFVGLFKYDDKSPNNNDNSGWQSGAGVHLSF